MSNVVQITNAAIPRGAVVRHKDGGSYMLAVGRIDDRTITVYLDGPEGNTMLAQFRTAELAVVLAPAQTGASIAGKAVKMGQR